MIRYRLRTAAGPAELELDVDNLTTPGAVAFVGDDAAVAALRRALLERLRIAGPAWRKVSGSVLIEWMESPAVRDLAPELVTGRDIQADGGTFSRHDPARGAVLLGRALASLASSPRSPELFADEYQWQRVGREVRYCRRELAALDQHGDASHAAALEAELAAYLVAERARGRAAAGSPAEVVAAFRAAAAASPDEAEVLRGLWRRLDAGEVGSAG